MTQFNAAIQMFFEPIALAIMLVYLYGMVQRTDAIDTHKSLFMGLIFGVASGVSMTMPITLSDGIFLDLRSLFIGIAAAYFGFIAGSVTLTIAVVVRLYIGGDGVAYAIPAMTIAMVMGLVWRRFYWPTSSNNKIALPVLGIMISLHLAIGLFLPPALRGDYLQNIVPIITLMDIIGAFILGGLLHREMTIARQATIMAEAATTDPLTKLMNRRQLETTVAKMSMPSRITTGRALMFFDVDEFKAINDSHGHPIGDATLLELTKRIQNVLRPTDHFARMGGDEFIVILPDATKAEARLIAERCRAAVSSELFQVGGARFPVSISLGVRWMDTPKDFFGHLSEADVALYEAKAGGRNRVVYRTSSDGPEATTMLSKVS